MSDLDHCFSNSGLDDGNFTEICSFQLAYRFVFDWLAESRPKEAQYNDCSLLADRFSPIGMAVGLIAMGAARRR